MQLNQDLRAGVPTRVSVAGVYFLLTDTGAADSVNLRIMLASGNTEDFQEAQRGLKVRLTAGMFTGLLLTAPIDCTIKFIATENPIDVDFTQGAIVRVSNNGAPLQVSNDRGGPGLPLNVVGVTLSDAPAAAHATAAPVAVTSAGAVIAAANAARRRVCFGNVGVDPVAIGPAGITWARRVVVLQPGDVWLEDKAANLAWSAICDATKTASVTVHEVTA